MKKIIATTLLCSALGHPAVASTGSFFKVTVNGPELVVTTTVPGHYYPNAGIKLGRGFSLNAPQALVPSYTSCTLINNGFCLFPVSDQQSATFDITGPKGPVDVLLSLNGAGPVTTQNVTKALPEGRFAYVSNANDVSSCYVNLTSGEFNTCTKTPGFSVPRNIAVNASGTRAYVVNNSLSISLCPIEAHTGTLSSCTTLSEPTSPQLNNPNGIALNAAGTVAYITNFGNSTVIKCSVNQMTGALSGCANTGGQLFNGVTDVILREEEHRAYVTLDSGPYYVCSLVPSTGELAQCQQYSSAGITAPQSITFNDTGTRAYIPNESFGGSVYLCHVQKSTGVLSNCQEQLETKNPQYNSNGNVLLNSTGTYAYYPSNSSFIKCAVNPSSGLLSSCTPTATTGMFGGPVTGSAFR
jgi:DNA-binding beta-propeller fold protein YncE